jgi:AraC-like DNA-binding protein
MDLIGFLYGFGLLHGVLLAGVLLYSSGGNRLANAFMAGLVSCIAIRFLFSWLIRTDVFMSYPQWSMLSNPLDFAWGPLLYLYAFAMTSKRVRPVQLLHFIPLLLMLSEPITLMLYPREQQVIFLKYFLSDRENVELGRQLFDVMPAFWRVWVVLHLHGILFSIQFAVYCALVLLRVRRHKQKLEQNFSFTEQMDLRWLRTLTLLCVLFLMLFLIFNRANIILYGHHELTAFYLNLPFLFLVLAIYIIGIKALRQPSILRGIIEADDADEEEQQPEAVAAAQDQVDPAGEVPPTKYTRSGINLEDAQRYKIRMMKAMQNEELYLDCDLTLRQLARHVGISYHQASQVINGQMNQRFFCFVNNYRVQLAKDLMSDPKTSKMAIVDLAVEVGFKSKSSFYDAFKRMTEMTPTQFKKSLETAS